MMTSPSRQDFAEATKRVLAQRAGTSCSNPACRAATSGPQVDSSRALNVGVAAHITAASPGGPRYDSSLTDDQRVAFENGVWLCQNCAKLIDNDFARYSVGILLEWKTSAERDALARIGRTAVAPEASTEIIDKWVNAQYPERLGIAPQLRHANFALVWASANEESERIDIDGWEHVIIDDKGRSYRLKIQDLAAIGGYLVLLKRSRKDSA